MALKAVDAKVLSIFVLLIVTGLAVLIPVRFHAMISRPKGQMVLRALSSAAGIYRVLFLSTCWTRLHLRSISGGLIFGTVFLHLMPEITQVFATYQVEDNKHIDYPVMEVTIGFGFILVFLLEKGVGSRYHRKAEDNCCNPDPTEVNFKVGDSGDPVSEKPTETSKQTTTDNVVRQTSTAQFIVSEDTGCMNEFEMLALNPGIKEYAFVIALSLHALIEGLVAGFFDDSSKVLTLLIGLALHKIPEGMVLVIQLFRGRVKWKMVAGIGIVFTTLSPIGLAIGTAVDESGSTNTPAGKLAESILQALGAGTLLYVVAMDILLTEFSTDEQQLQKWFCFVIGFSVIAGITFIPHEHLHLGDPGPSGCNGNGTGM